MRELIDHVVDGVPGVLGALVGSTDGFLIAARLPENDLVDPSAVAAMSASSLALSTRLVQLAGTAPATTTVMRSSVTKVFVFALGPTAVLTILAERWADDERIERIGYEVSWSLERALEDQPPPA
jgi:predicted regulator of Ras-like GTPase activity (Roadblock/LC7/MglB family)